MPKQFIGKVVSTHMQKTLVVEVKTSRAHPLYKKRVTKHKRFKVHSQASDVKLGDTVKIVETRPISKEKRFKLLEVVR